MKKEENTKEFCHISVMPEEVLDFFSELNKGSTIVDGTLGKGGHSKALLDSGFKVIGVDRDKEAIKEVTEKLKGYSDIKIIHGNFADIKEILREHNIEEVDGILLDLGVSTYQLRNQERGFGFEGKLDMRMNQEQELTASEVINNYSEEKLSEILKKHGEKAFPQEISKAIIEKRKTHKITDSHDLLEIIKNALPEKYKKTRKHHWATPTFRALRIEVNKDFENLEKFLEEFKDILSKGGILCIITFHTKEESIVRKHLRYLKGQKIIRLETKKGIEPSKKEISKNPKAKRAKLWVARRK